MAKQKKRRRTIYIVWREAGCIEEMVSKITRQTLNDVKGGCEDYKEWRREHKRIHDRPQAARAVE